MSALVQAPGVPPDWQSKLASVASGAADPQGNWRFSVPPAAAYSHSASVGSRPPSHAQKANATNQLRQLMGRSSLGPGSLVQVFEVSQAKLATSAAVSPGMYVCQSKPSSSQPNFEIFECPPTLLAG